MTLGTKAFPYGASSQENHRRITSGKNARSKWPCSNGRRSRTSLPLLWAIPGLSCWLTANGGIKPGYRFERGCHVEMYMHISQELFCAKICNNLAGHG